MSLLGLDVGTTGTKALVFSEAGEVLGAGYREYPLLQPHAGWAELEPARVWKAVCEAIREAVATANGDPVTALAVSSQGEAAVPVDRELNPLYNTATCFCARSEPYVTFWRDRLSDWQLYEITGHRQSHIFTIHKLLWLRENQPAIFEKAWKFLCYEDFVLAKLGAEPATDYSMATRTFCFDIRKMEWSPAIMQGTGVDPSRFAVPHPCGTQVGTVSACAAAETGIPEGAALVTGAHDQCAGALGAGVVEPGMAVDSIGTVECFTAAFPEPVLNERMFASGYPCYPHAAPGLFVTLAWNFSSGAVLRWYRDTFGEYAAARADRLGADIYEVLLSGLPEGPSPVLLLPYFTASATPYFDTDAKGVLAGLTLSTTREDVVKAILDGTSYEMRLNLDLWAEAGVPVQRIRAMGGGAKSRLWLQQKADIFGVPVARLNVSEAACLGMAIAAGAATGVYSSMQDAAASLVREVEVFEPTPSRAAAYEEKFELYKQLYPSLKPILNALR